MNENTENKQIEDFLRKAHLFEPSAKLKEQIIHEAQKTWTQIPSELPWQVPVKRLIVSAAAAVFIIWLTNCSSDYTMSLWRSGERHVASPQPPELDTLPELSYSPLSRHLVSTNRRPTIIDASALSNYTETLRQVLNESQQNGVSKPSAPTEGRSILLRQQPSFQSYS